MRIILKSFLNGLLIISPIAFSLYVLYALFIRIDDLLPIETPGVGFLVTVSAITLVGFLARNIFARKIIDFVEELFTKLPFVKLLYGSIKDLIGAFVGDKKSFDKPVMVNLGPDGSLRAIGFVTMENMVQFGMPDYSAVYFPQSFNFAGNLLLIHNSKIQRLDMPSSDTMTFVVSGGVSRK
ncbi:MAG TPA: DUF502 domain-containing protein [Desulfobacteria bacterium]|nr:DUF502 domain-containing protein [Desulfobacteria bacterium]